jgi:hypothetical protein
MPDPVPLDIVPGVVKSQTPVSVKGRWIDANWVRFRAGKPEKIRGWVKLIDETLIGTARGSLGWITRAGDNCVTLGTEFKLYAIVDLLDDITPLRASGNLTNPFSTVNASAVVTVTHASHGLDDGAHVHFSGASAVGGIVVGGEYTVTEVVDNNSYTITHSSAATSTAGPGGGTVAYEYEINPGTSGGSYGTGWGAGGWGGGTWGTPRDVTDAIELEFRFWSIAKYGHTILACPSGGTLYMWDQPNGDPRAEAVANAPAMANAMFVTAERFPVMLGTSTSMTMQWPDRDDITDWTPSASNNANIRTLQHGSKLMNGTAIGDDINLVWSDTSLYQMIYDGSDLVYQTKLAAENCGLIARGAFAAVEGQCLWMGTRRFWLYTGFVQVAPNSTDIEAYVFDNLNVSYTYKCFASFNPKNNEVWFHYPSGESTECDRYVAVCLDDWAWTTGALVRTAMTYLRTPGGGPVMAGADSHVYEHETGLDADGAAIEAYIEAGLVAIAHGKSDIDVSAFVPDTERQAGDLLLRIRVTDQPRSADALEENTFVVTEEDDLIDIDMSGRFLGFRIASSEPGGDFRLGTPRLEMAAGGEDR